MIVEIITDLKEIQEKLNLSKELPIFATQEYADYLLNAERIKTMWFIEKVDNTIKFIIPFALKNKLIFKVGYFLTAVNNLSNNNIESEKQFLEEVVSLIKKKRLCDWITQHPNWALFKVVPSNAIYCEFGTYRIELSNKDEEDIFNKIRQDTRRRIRQALSENIIIKSGVEYLDDCKEIFVKAHKQGNHTLPVKKEIDDILEFLPDSTYISIAYKNDIPQAGCIMLTNNYCAYGLYLGVATASSPSIGHLLIWQSIIDAKRNGVKYFDFVGARINPVPGSKQEKIQIFKRHFGGEFHIGFLWKMPIRKFKYTIYNILVHISCLINGKKNEGDIIDQELRRLNA